MAVSSRPVPERREAFEWLGIESQDRFSLLVDEHHGAFRDYGCYGSGPQHGLFLIDRSGVIRARYVGESPYDHYKELAERIRRLGTPSASMPSGPRPGGSSSPSAVVAN